MKKLDCWLGIPTAFSSSEEYRGLGNISKSLHPYAVLMTSTLLQSRGNQTSLIRLILSNRRATILPKVLEIWWVGVQSLQCGWHYPMGQGREKWTASSNRIPASMFHEDFRWGARLDTWFQVLLKSLTTHLQIPSFSYGWPSPQWSRVHEDLRPLTSLQKLPRILDTHPLRNFRCQYSPKPHPQATSSAPISCQE